MTSAPRIAIVLVGAGLLLAAIFLTGHFPARPWLAAAVVSALLLETQARPLSNGWFSPSTYWCIALAGFPAVGSSGAVVAGGLAIAARVLTRGANNLDPLTAWSLDFIPPALSALAWGQLGPLPAAPICLLAAVPLPMVLANLADDRDQSGKSRDQLWLEHLALVLLAPVSILLGKIHPGLMMAVWPSVLALLKVGSTGSELTQYRSSRFALKRAHHKASQQQQELGLVAQQQAQKQRLLDARAETFALLEGLSSRPLSEAQALEEALQALQDRLPGGLCLFVPVIGDQPQWPPRLQQAPPALQSSLRHCWVAQQPWLATTAEGAAACWPLPGRGLLWLETPVALGCELQQTLSVFFRYLQVMLDRMRFQQNILESLQIEGALRQELGLANLRLHSILAGASQLTVLVQPREVLDYAVQMAQEWTQGRPCSAQMDDLLVGQRCAREVSFAGTSGVFRVEAEGLSEPQQEALQLWALLVDSALRRCKEQANLAHGNKLAAIGQLAAGIAHELNTPLGAINLGIQIAMSFLHKDPAKAQSRLEIANKAVEQMRSIISKLLNYARESGSGSRPVCLQALVEDSLPLVAHQFQIDQTQLQCDLQPVTIRVNSGEIQQVVVNLLVNARQAVAGCRAATVRVVLRVEAEEAILEVVDNGPGVPEEILERIFDPFFTTKEVGQGLGLGLAISREIVVAHGGQLSHYRPVQGGAGFCLQLPRFLG